MSPMAPSHREPFSHAVMAALQLTTFGTSGAPLPAAIRRNSSTACPSVKHSKLCKHCAIQKLAPRLLSKLKQCTFGLMLLVKPHVSSSGLAHQKQHTADTSFVECVFVCVCTCVGVCVRVIANSSWQRARFFFCNVSSDMY